MPSLKRLIPAIILTLLAAVVVVPVAAASTTQEAVIQDDGQLRANLVGTMSSFRDIGVTRVKVAVTWNRVAPDPTSRKAPKGFSATNPAAYPAANWSFYDSVVRQAKLDGLQVGFEITGPAPLWATGAGDPKNCGQACGGWKVSTSDFQAFAKAVGERYDGHYTPSGYAVLPAVRWWSVWNEPNYGPDISPQAIDNGTVDFAAIEYRGLLDAAWSGLAASGHKPSTDTILIGETAPRGVAGKGLPGNFGGTLPVPFLQSLYCVNSANRRLTGSAAAANDCPSSAGAFKAENPVLFSASGFATHPYAQGTPPNTPTYACKIAGINTFCFNTKTKKSTAGYADFAELGRLESLLDTLNRTYGSSKKYPIWNTEFGYWTDPPDTRSNPIEAVEAVSPSEAAYYDNWAEYLSYTQPRVASFDQYLLVDPVDDAFSDGLLFSDGTPKPGLDAFTVPLYMPTTSASHAASLTVWGGVRPAAETLSATGLHQQAQIQFQPSSGGGFTTVKTVTITNSRGYFDVHQTFTQSGTVRIAWAPSGGATVYSRSQTITVK